MQKIFWNYQPYLTNKNNFYKNKAIFEPSKKHKNKKNHNKLQLQ